MCPGKIFHTNQSRLYLKRFSSRFKSVLLLITIVMLGFLLQAQENGTPVEIPTLDMRGQSPTDATYAALQNSKKDMIVVLIRGGSQELIDRTTGEMKALHHKGYTRIGIILCDLKPGEVAPVLGVVADNMAYAVIKKAKPDSTTSWKIYKLVEDAYEEFILPKVKKGSNSN